MTDPIPLHAQKPPKTSPEVATALREALEKMIENGLDAGMISGEVDGQVVWCAVPALSGFAKGHLISVLEEMDNIE